MTADLGIGSDGDGFWKWIVEDREAMVQQLLTAPAAPVAEHDENPPGPGVYLVPCGAKAVLVMLVADLRRQLRAAVDPDGEGGSKDLPFYLARSKASQAGLDLPCERKLLEAEPAFRDIHTQTKAEVLQLLVRYLTLEDLIRGQVPAPYSEVLRDPTAQHGGI